MWTLDDKLNQVDLYKSWVVTVVSPRLVSCTFLTTHCHFTCACACESRTPLDTTQMDKTITFGMKWSINCSFSLFLAIYLTSLSLSLQIKLHLGHRWKRFLTSQMVRLSSLDAFDRFLSIQSSVTIRTLSTHTDSTICNGRRDEIFDKSIHLNEVRLHCLTLTWLTKWIELRVILRRKRERAADAWEGVSLSGECAGEAERHIIWTLANC